MPSISEALRRIHDDAVSTATSVSELLRRVQVFAVRADQTELAQWVRFELNGYPDDAELPDYRVMKNLKRRSRRMARPAIGKWARRSPTGPKMSSQGRSRALARLHAKSPRQSFPNLPSATMA